MDTKVISKEQILHRIAEQQPQFRNSHDALVYLLHTIMKELQFKCVGCGESDDETQITKPVPDAWNQSTDSYTLRYRDGDSATFILKGLRLEDQLLIHGMPANDSSQLQNWDLSVKSYIKSGISLNDYQNLYQNVDSLFTLFKINMINKLVLPSTTSSSTTTRQQRDPLRDYDHDPLRVPGSGRPNPLIDPYYGSYPSSPTVPFGIGGHDVFPQVPPMPGAPGWGQEPGNLIGPGHPGFGPLPGTGGNRMGGRGRGRGGLPPGHPPGARFDPFGPPGTGGFGNPDNDDLPPPHYGDMYM